MEVQKNDESAIEERVKTAKEEWSVPKFEELGIKSTKGGAFVYRVESIHYRVS